MTRKVTNVTTELSKEIRAFTNKISGLWGTGTKLSSKVFRHCVKNDHSEGLLVQMYSELMQTDHKTLTDAFKLATHAITGMRFSFDEKNKCYKCKKDKKHWNTVKNKFDLNIAELEQKGLVSYKKTTKKKTGSKDPEKTTAPVDKTVYEMESDNLTSMRTTWNELAPGDEDRINFESELKTLVEKYQPMVSALVKAMSTLQASNTGLIKQSVEVEIKEDKEEVKEEVKEAAIEPTEKKAA